MASATKRTKATIPRTKVLSESAKAEVISLRRSFADIQNIESLHHRIDCGDCAKRYRDAADRVHIKTLILDRIDQLNTGAA